MLKRKIKELTRELAFNGENSGINNRNSNNKRGGSEANRFFTLEIEEMR